MWIQPGVQSFIFLSLFRPLSPEPVTRVDRVSQRYCFDLEEEKHLNTYAGEVKGQTQL